METNHKTYTYTARSINNPSNVVTFTLYNNHLRINLTGVVEQAGTVAQAEEKSAEVKTQISTQAKPAVMKLVENLAGPTHINDVNTHLEGDKLKVILWQRTAGLRLAPVIFNMKKVDNIEAAEAFVNEVDQRKTYSSNSGRLWGPLDYWIGWAGLLVTMGIFLRWLRQRNRS